MKFPQSQTGLYCLNKGWRFKEITRIFDVGENNETHAHDEIYNATKGGNQQGIFAATFDDNDWETVTLPHDWVTRKDFDKNQSSSGGYKERGVAWYRHNFRLNNEDRDKQILLEFEGMSAEATVYVNGFILERSFSGYTPFSVDITDVANFDLMPNTVAVYIDARGKEGWWYEGAGIYRNVWMVKKPTVHMAYDGVFIKPVKKENGWQIDMQIETENSFKEDLPFTIEVEITSENGTLQIKHDPEILINGFSKKTVGFTIPFDNPILWDIGNPYLYTAKVSVKTNNTEDFIIIPFGFRTISTCPDTGFYLNGKNIKLLGMCNHQDHAGVGVAVPYAIKEWRVKLLKELGANAYRCAHNTDPEILDICDRLGMLVMEENRTFSPSKDAVRNIELMVRHSRNHPCVVMYSIFNEEPTAGSYKGYLISGRLCAAIKKHDTTRPTTCAMNGGYMEEHGASAIVDIPGINYHPSAYKDFHQKFPHKPLVGSETTASFSQRGEWKTDLENNIISGHDEACASWSYHVRTAWKPVATQPFVMGTFVWTGFDYRGEPTPCPWPAVSSFFGTYDHCGFPKDPVYLYKAYWLNEPLVHIVPHWNIPVEEGTEVRVRVFTNCGHVKVFLNGKCVGEQDNDIYEQTIFLIPYEKGELTAVGYNQGIQAVTTSVKTSKAADRLKIELTKPVLLNDGFDAIAVNIKALDENGLFDPSAQHLVNFTITGGADIIGVGNGNQNSHEPDFASYRQLYNGRCQAVIKSNEGNEKIIFTATADGLISDKVEIKVVDIDALQTGDGRIPSPERINTKVILGWKIYKEVFEEIPDANMQIESSDNNSFVAVSFDHSHQPLLDNQLGKYAMYRTVCDFGKNDVSRSLYIGQISGFFWLYINGKLMYHTEDCRYRGSIEYKIPDDITGKQNVTVILRHMHEYWAHAGIYTPVIIKEYPKN
jgi:beta-galactosidase